MKIHQRGFSLVELLLAFAVLALISVITVSSLSGVNRNKALAVEAENMLSLLAKARSLTLAAKDGSVYGVHFEETQAVLFTGSTYNAVASSNQAQRLHDAVHISSISLSGGASDVVFQKLSGVAAQTGTVRLSLAADANASTTVTITGTGVAYSN